MMNSLFLTLLFVGIAFGAVVLNNHRAEGPACPIDDPLAIEAGAINITVGDLSAELILEIFVGSLQNGGVATGLSALTYTYNIDVLDLAITFEVLIPGTACASGDHYEAQGTANFSPFTQDTLPTGPFTGVGAYDACISDTQFAGSAFITTMIDQTVRLSGLHFSEIVFTGVQVNLEDLMVNDVPVDWVDFNENFKSRFDAQFDNNGVAFTERLRSALDFHLRQYTLQDIIDIIGGGGDGTPAPCRQH